MIYLYIAIIVLACAGIVAFFVLYNKKQNKIKQRLKELGECGNTLIKSEKVDEHAKEKDTLDAESKEAENVSEMKSVVSVKENGDDQGKFEDFVLEDPNDRAKNDDAEKEDENPFFKKKFFFDDDDKDTDYDFANDPFDEVDGLEKYKQMLREERDKIKFDDFDDDYIKNKFPSSNSMDEEFKKILLDENKSNQEDE